MSILDELSAQDKILTDAEKVTKILCTFPESFDSIAKASSLNDNSVD